MLDRGPADGQVDRADMSSDADQAAAIDWAAEQNDLDGRPYAGHLDLDRVVAAGNSCGGVTHDRAHRLRTRVTAAFVLSGSGTLPARRSGRRRP